MGKKTHHKQSRLQDAAIQKEETCHYNSHLSRRVLEIF